MGRPPWSEETPCHSPSRSRSTPRRRPAGRRSPDACDRLYAESAPFSEYERYASTCGGRVKPFAVAYCTELE
jgi:hypothetical protein